MMKITWIIAYPWRIMLCRHLGDAHFSWLIFWLHSWVLLSVLFVGAIWGAFTRYYGSDFMPRETQNLMNRIGEFPPLATTLFLALLIFFQLLNWHEQRNRREQGLLWYSRCEGIPRFFEDGHFAQRWLIPCSAAAIGMGCMPSYLGCYLLLAGLADFVRGRFALWLEYRSYWDMQDARFGDRTNAHQVLASDNAIATGGLAYYGIRPLVKVRGVENCVADMERREYHS